ncbi:MAG: hypothetical protein KDK34_13525, partial [Leptospiraceae bacterium]|nr:hypothetical protein [Leptospiraceae bacterium]
TNITMAANSAYQRGGGIYATASALVTLVNATVISNTANNGGSGLYVYNTSSTVNVYNSVFYNNGSGQDLLNESGATLNGEKTYTQQIPSGYGSPEGFYKLSLDPFFRSDDPDGPDNLYGTDDDGLRLSNAGKLKNIGNTLLNKESIDLLGNSRLNGISVDIGAYEN